MKMGNISTVTLILYATKNTLIKQYAPPIPLEQQQPFSGVGRGAMDTGRLAGCNVPKSPGRTTGGSRTGLVRGRILNSPTVPRVPQGAVISGVIVDAVTSATREASLEDELEVPAASDASTGVTVAQCHMNTTVALVSNALIQLENTGGSKVVECYLTKLFQQLGETVVRTDFANYLGVVATQRMETADELWTQMLKARTPGLSSLVKNAPALTALNDYQLHQFTVRPCDLGLAFSGEQVRSVAMCAMMAEMADRLECVEAQLQRPSDDSICIESVVKSAIAPLVEAGSRPKLTATRKKTPVAPTKAKEVTFPALRAHSSQKESPTDTETPPSFSEILLGRQKRAAKARSNSVTGSAGAYVGPNVDKHLKIHVGSACSREQVIEAVSKATQVQTSNITVEALTHSARNYSMAYRVRILAMRADLATSLLSTNLWPAGMLVSIWKGGWQPLRKHKSIRIFVGNVSTDTTPETVAGKLKAIYEQSNIPISSSVAEKFVGKKEEPSLHQNLIVSLITTAESIDMEPIQQAKQSQAIPPRIFVRMYRERQPAAAPAW